MSEEKEIYSHARLVHSRYLLLVGFLCILTVVNKNSIICVCLVDTYKRRRPRGV